MGRKGKKHLSGEEKALWDRVAKTTTPLKPGTRQAFAPTVQSDPKQDRAAPRTHPLPLQHFRIGEKSAPKHGAVQSSPAVSDRLAQAPVRMDHGSYKQMVRGKLKPEGRIDLHGMTLAQAHPALTGFILDAYDAQKRLVLVITGKGKDRDDTDPIPIRRGVLRHQVPNWLHTPPLGALVLDIREAHQKHGGGGAYYVYLKRHR